jgi:hypothetical protein
MDIRRPAGLTRELEALLHQACTAAVEQAEAARRGFRLLEEAELAKADALGLELRRRTLALTTRIVAAPAVDAGAPGARALLAIPGHFERVAEHVDALVATVRQVRNEGLPFTDRARKEVAGLGDMTLDVLTTLRDMVRTWNPVLARHLVEAADRAAAQSDEFAASHRERLILGECVPRASPAFVAVLDHLDSVRRHAREMAIELTREAPAA